MNDKDKADVSRMAAAVLGAEPTPAPQGAQDAQPAQPAQPPQPKDSAQDKAAEEGSPKTEDDKSSDNPVIYEIPMGDGVRRMTPEQISSTLGRYASMNQRHAELTPILDVVGKIAKETGATTADEVVSKLTALAEANEKSPQMGKDQTPNDTVKDTSKPQSAEEISAALSQWEEENAVSLPPGYKDAIVNQGQSQQEMMQQMQNMQQMMQQVLASAAGSADAARTAMGDSNAQQVQAIQRQIANNIDRAQQQLQLPDEKAQDFMIFAAERGYTLEDFANPRLTQMVMTDFKNDMDSPEMDRLRQMAQRRQAFTGSVGSTPASGPADAATSKNDPLAQMTDAALARRMQS